MSQSDLLVSDFAKELLNLIDQPMPHGSSLFDEGRKFGLKEAASLLLEEAKSFGADIEVLGLTVLNDRSDLL